MIKAIKVMANLTSNSIGITGKEFDAFCESGEYVVSDIDYGYDIETGEFTVPSIEWESSFGRYWERFNTEEKRQEVLDKYDEGLARWVIDYRVRKAVEIRIKREERARIKSLKTLGGQFEQLKKLRELVA